MELVCILRAFIKLMNAEIHPPVSRGAVGNLEVTFTNALYSAQGRNTECYRGRELTGDPCFVPGIAGNLGCD